MTAKLKGLTLLKNTSDNFLQNRSLQFAELSFDKTINSIDHITDTKISSGTDSEEFIIIPGFIDIHVHGGGGADTMDGEDAIRSFAKFHLQHGTTTLYPTTITNPWQNIITALQAVKTVSRTQFTNELQQEHSLPSIPGAHLEGPFISPNRLGAQPAHAILPTAKKVQQVIELDIIKLLTMAPELPKVVDAALEFAKAACRISIGHTSASYEDIVPFVSELRKHSATIGYTHLYNAMGGMSGRVPDVVGSALADKECYAELILDMHHVHPASFLTAFHAKVDKLILITDAMRACGLADGKSELGGQEVFVQDGMAKMSDGTLAGSVLTMDVAFKNALETGLDIGSVSKLVSETPANYMGLSDRGTLDIGKRADIVVMNKDFDIIEVYVAGKKLYG